METLFFIASKTVGMVARVESWALFLMALALWGLWRGRLRLAGWTLGTVFTGTLALTLLPLGDLLLDPLERSFPARIALPQVDGIIVLGGAETTGAHRLWGGPQLNEAGERLIESAMLAHRFPAARLVFTGGSATVGRDEDTTDPSEMVRATWIALGIAPDRITLEQTSRNTAENARLTHDLVQPQPGETWVLVTSAFHMPRAHETFVRNGWQGIIAWPVDFRSGDLAALRGIWRLDRNLLGVNLALKEFLGTLAYRITGK
ncbi:YdcF family protein [Tabrizicola aquatica]|uniref:YdcF family protein n=1 Tax=Tabrizicola aquatica TaxID=909926 RepID=UPI000CD09E1B|nr:YdcF family protein [Tabrizicola aquatica]